MEKSGRLSPTSSPGGNGTDSTMTLSVLADTEDMVSGLSGTEELTDLTNVNDKNNTDTGKTKLQTMFERKQLLHDIQLLRIELSQKSLIIDNLKAEHMNTTEELEERLHDALHKKQMLQARLESALAIQQDESQKHQLQVQRDLKIILDRQRDLERTNRQLHAKASHIRSQLERDCHISENQYVELKSKPVDELTIAEYFSLRLYESMQPLMIERNNLHAQRNKLSEEMGKLMRTLHSYEQEIMQERRQRSQAEIKVNSTSSELEKVQKQLEERTGKATRFDAVNEERNRLDKENGEVSKKLAYLEAEHSGVLREMGQLKNERDCNVQELQLLKQDKEYLTRNLTDASAKLDSTSDTLISTQRKLEQVTTTREELYEKYAASREEARVAYERRLQTELDRIRIQTEEELGKVRTDSKEAYERENHNLREARDLAVQERDQLKKSRDSAEKRCEAAIGELRQLESTIDARVAEYQNETRIKTFELDRLQLIHEETCANLERTRVDVERNQRKLELVTQEHSELQRSASANEAELRSTVRDLNTRLATYDKLEKEMDDIVMQAAEVDDKAVPDQAERVLFSYGYGANVPITAKRRMKQSVHLARRVLQLERNNASLQQHIQQREEQQKKLCEKLADSERLLDESKQPYSYLIESMRKRDEQVEQLRTTCSHLEAEREKLAAQNKQLSESKRAMSADLDRLLNHREELHVIKKIVADMTSSQRTTTNDVIDDDTLLEALQRAQKCRPIAGVDDKVVGSNPSPVVFTRQADVGGNKLNCERYKKLKQLMKDR